MTVELSVVVPVYNEAENVGPLAREVAAALQGRDFELIVVDDGSGDGTAAAALAARSDGIPQLRLLRHSQRCGQSRALCSGVAAARAAWVATLDGDGQNDPADIVALLETRDRPEHAAVELFIGHRVQRRDTVWRRLQSRIANGIRAALLGDRTPDTGCGLKLFKRERFRELPQFDHMHRFLPALFVRAGAIVVSVPVRHRPRAAGRSKYGMWDRLWVGIVDLLGVMWLRRRWRAGLIVREE
ncbi:MAG: glycosyltransferase [Steroidobacteraceae bacterium]|nr:glycosyltransferase [Steroidobacteraceae bacterium]MDW8260568.1 glycosyltransferase [Gammaproteobacteria bacterium]